jgi:cysteine desulfurase
MVYLDYNATTPIDARVRLSMDEIPELIGNPGSIQHQNGIAAEAHLEASRAEIARLLGFSSQEVIFTSGASESAAIALYGFALHAAKKLSGTKTRILTTRLEHKAILETLENITEITDLRIEFVPVTNSGFIDLEALKEKVSGDVLLGCFMSVNNETGVVQDLLEIANLLHENGALLVSDFTQAIGKTSLEGIASTDAAFFSGHKIYGPPGMGSLLVRRLAQKQMFKILHGGGQERGLRGGTQNVRGAVGLSEAVKIALAEFSKNDMNFQRLRAFFIRELQSAGVAIEVNGDLASSVSNTLNFQILDVDSDELLANCKDLSVATGSACNSANPEPSHVLLGMGLGFRRASESVRVSLGRSTTEAELREAVAIIADYAIPAQRQTQGGSE